MKLIPVPLCLVFSLYTTVCGGEIGPEMFLKFEGTVHAESSFRVVPLWPIDETLYQTAFARLYYSCQGRSDESGPDPRGIYVGVSAGKDQQGSLVLAPSSTLRYGWDQDTKTFYFNVYPYNDCLVHFRIRERNKADRLSHRTHSEDL